MADHVHPGQTEQIVKDAPRSNLYAARTAICFMNVNDDRGDETVYRKLCNALEADSRVETINAPTQDPSAFDRPSFALFGPYEDHEFSSKEDRPPDPSTHTHGFSFSDPIVFEAHAPRRVQPTFDDFDRIPADSYWAAWDGIALVVIWKLEDIWKTNGDFDQLDIDKVSYNLTPSGGLLVQTVLKDAAEKCGYELTTTPCSPNCGYTFAHTGLFVRTVDYEHYGQNAIFEKKSEESFARVCLPVIDDSPADAAEELQREVGFITRIFAEMRSEGRTAVAAGRLIQYDVRKLLRLNYQRADISARPFYRTFKSRWSTRRWQQQTRRLMARMWLTLATLDEARQDWAYLKYLYDNAAEDGNKGAVFDSEYINEINSTSAIDVSEARSALDRITNTLDTKAVVLATSAGAIFGALIGALAAHFI